MEVGVKRVDDEVEKALWQVPFPHVSLATLKLNPVNVIDWLL